MEQPERAGWEVAVAGARRWRVIARVLAPGDAHLQADLRQAMVLALVGLEPRALARHVIETIERRGVWRVVYGKDAR